MKEKISFLEKDLIQSKDELESQRSDFSSQLYSSSQELQQCRVSLSLCEQRLKQLDSDKTRVEAQLEEKVKALSDAKEARELKDKETIEEQGKTIKMMEEKNAKMQNSLDKDQALLAQKILFTEKENSVL